MIANPRTLQVALLCLALACTRAEQPLDRAGYSRPASTLIGGSLDAFAFDTIDGRRLSWDAQRRLLGNGSILGERYAYG